VADEAVRCEPVSDANSLLRKLTGNFADSDPPARFSRPVSERIQWLAAEFPAQWNREFLYRNRERFGANREFSRRHRKRPFFAHLFAGPPDPICSHRNFAGEEDKTDQLLHRARYGVAFWRAHHEAWRRSELNQREYCQAQGISLKAFGNWRAKFKARRAVSLGDGGAGVQSTSPMQRRPLMRR
jgi:hypothetical protein